jgi:hypothetical protein
MALQRRLPPSVPLRLELDTDSGMKDIREFKLSFTVNAAAVIKEKTRIADPSSGKIIDPGVSLLNFIEAWSQISDPRLLRLMFWAAVLAHHPEYDTKDEDGKPNNEGLETIGSLVDETVSDQIGEALWQAYLKSLSKDKRDAVIKVRKMAEDQAKSGNPPVPSSVSPDATTATMTTTGSNSGPSPGISASELKNSAA